MYASIWTWEKCRNKLKTLQGRLGFPNTSTLTFLQLAVSLETGEILDEIKQKPYPEIKPTIYCILSGYARAEPATETKRLISFSRLPGGAAYNTAFIRRAVQPLERTFGNHAHRLWNAAKIFNAERLSYSDHSVKIHALPFAPITIILHEATSEFAASVNMLFDSTINNYLTTEQIAMLSQLTSLRLAQANEAIT